MLTVVLSWPMRCWNLTVSRCRTMFRRSVAVASLLIHKQMFPIEIQILTTHFFSALSPWPFHSFARVNLQLHVMSPTAVGADLGPSDDGPIVQQQHQFMEDSETSNSSQPQSRVIVVTPAASPNATSFSVINYGELRGSIIWWEGGVLSRICSARADTFCCFDYQGGW